ncbi:MAG: sugar-binding protein, partial [Kiritimatiellia bacterium]|nr:sugar-binding protein [Kiritimatiellia bacterium]
VQLLLAVRGRSGEDEVNKGPQQYQEGNRNFPAEKVRFATTRVPGGYEARIAIPWDALENLKVSRKSMLGFSLSVRDVDSRFRERRRVFWSGGNDNFQNTHRFGLLLLDAKDDDPAVRDVQ